MIDAPDPQSRHLTPDELDQILALPDADRVVMGCAWEAMKTHLDAEQLAERLSDLTGLEIGADRSKAVGSLFTRVLKGLGLDT